METSVKYADHDLQLKETVLILLHLALVLVNWINQNDGNKYIYWYTCAYSAQSSEYIKHISLSVITDKSVKISYRKATWLVFPDY